MRKGELMKSFNGIEVRKFFDLVLVVAEEFSTTVEKIAKNECADIIILRKNAPNDYFFKSEKIGYLLDLSKINNADNLIKSSRRRSIRVKKKLFKVRIEEPLTVETLKSWFDIYEKMIKSMKYGLKHCSKKWLKKGEKTGIFLEHDKIIVGGIVIAFPKGEPSISFSAFEKDFIKHRPMEILVHEFINWAKRKGFKNVRYGVDTNFYGYHLSIGLHLYKKSWGFIPEPKNNFEYFKITNFQKLNDKILFFEGKECRPVLIFKKELDKEIIKKIENSKVFLVGPGQTRTADLRLVRAAS